MDRHVLRSPSDVVAAIPALLGFRPEDSLVALCLSSWDRTLACAARFDLNVPVVELERSLHQLGAAAEPSVFLLVAYPESHVDLAPLAESLRGDRLHLIDFLVVEADRFRSLLCANPSCCPPEGHPVPSETATLEAARVLRGLPNVANDREELVSRYELREALVQELVQEARAVTQQSLVERCRAAVELIESLALGEGRPVHKAELLWLLQDHDVRDHILCQIALPSPDQAKAQVIIDAALVAPDHMRSRVAGTAAALLFLTGTDSVGTWAMIGHAGQDSLAQLVSRAMSSFLPPDEFRDVLAKARTEIEQRIQASTHAPDLRVPEAC